MRCTENERYCTAESAITWPLNPLIQQTPPAFFIAAVSWNETLDQPDYPGLPQTNPDYPRTCCKEHYALFRFPPQNFKKVHQKGYKGRPLYQFDLVSTDYRHTSAVLATGSTSAVVNLGFAFSSCNKIISTVLTGLDYLSSSRALTRAFKCRGWRAPSR